MKRTIVRATAFLVSIAALVDQGFALEASRSLDIKAPPAAVWALIGDFSSIAKWHPMVESYALSKNEGDEGKSAATRSLVAAGNLGTIVEVKTRRDEKAISYSSAYVWVVNGRTTVVP